MRRGLYCVVVGAALYALTPMFSRGDTIDFDSQGLFGPNSFADAGPAQTLSITTSVGVVTLQGGVILTGETGNADTSSVYATINSSQMTNPITIMFPIPVTNFSLTVDTGVGFAVTYIVADNAGHSQSSTVPVNGVFQPSFAMAGTTVTVDAVPTALHPNFWDFSIDNIAFDSVPEPSSMTLSLVALGGLALLVRRKRQH